MPHSASKINITKITLTKCGLYFTLVHLCVEVNPRFYRGKEKEQSDNKNGELKASRKV